LEWATRRAERLNTLATLRDHAGVMRVSQPLFHGMHFGDYISLVALGIDIDGVRHSLAVEKGSTENATCVAVQNG
jgi:hypothetical protein